MSGNPRLKPCPFTCTIGQLPNMDGKCMCIPADGSAGQGTRTLPWLFCAFFLRSSYLTHAHFEQLLVTVIHRLTFPHGTLYASLQVTPCPGRPAETSLLRWAPGLRG
jgi:hypothetical protein